MSDLPAMAHAYKSRRLLWKYRRCWRETDYGLCREPVEIDDLLGLCDEHLMELRQYG